AQEPCSAGPGDCFRGAKPGESPNFVPRPNDYKVDAETGFVRETHGVSVFDNSGSVSSKGFIPHQIDESSFPDTLRVIQRAKDPRHFETVPAPRRIRLLRGMRGNWQRLERESKEGSDGKCMTFSSLTTCQGMNSKRKRKAI